MQVRTTLIPTCPGSMCSFACQPRLTGLVVQEHQGLATRVCAHPARAMPLARTSHALVDHLDDLSCSGPV